jgi:NAD(P)-dependent dehydrogenase (short-subunit alcohol dehydrogenase family)
MCMGTQLKALRLKKIIQLDTGDESSILAVAKEIKGVPVDLLINNAGVYHAHGLDATSKDEMMAQFAVNTVGPFLLTRALLPNLREAVAQRGAAFVAQIGSIMGSIASNTTGGSYGSRASKAALHMVTKSLAVDLRGDKIGCLLLHPGFVKSKMADFDGDVTPEETVASMAAILDRATLAESGKLLHYETGDVIPW